MVYQKHQINKVNLPSSKQIKPYEAIIILIYSVGGIIYFIQALIAPGLIGLAPGNFSGTIVHLLIIISFCIISFTSYRIVEDNFLKEFKSENLKYLFIGYLVAFSSVIFGVDGLLLLYGLVIIYFVPGASTVILFLRSREIDILNNTKQISNQSEPYYNEFYASPFNKIKNFENNLKCLNCGESYEKNSVFCDQCGNKII